MSLRQASTTSSGPASLPPVSPKVRGAIGPVGGLITRSRSVGWRCSGGAGRGRCEIVLRPVGPGSRTPETVGGAGVTSTCASSGDVRPGSGAFTAGTAHVAAKAHARVAEANAVGAGTDRRTHVHSPSPPSVGARILLASSRARRRCPSTLRTVTASSLATSDTLRSRARCSTTTLDCSGSRGQTRPTSHSASA